MTVFERILCDGVAQQVEPHDGHREADHGDDDGSWGAEKHHSDHQRLKSSRLSPVRLTGLAEEDAMVVDVTEEEQEAWQR